MTSSHRGARALTALASLSAIAMLASGPLSAGDARDPASAIAEKFADAARSGSAPPPAAKTEEQKLLEKLADVKRKADEARERAAAAAVAEEAAAAEREAEAKREADEKRRAEEAAAQQAKADAERRAAEEQEMLARARREAEERAKLANPAAAPEADAPPAEAEASAPGAAVVPTEDTASASDAADRRIAEEAAEAAGSTAPADPADPAELAAQREAEARGLAERLRETRAERHRIGVPPSLLDDPLVAADGGVKPSRVTILIRMDVGERGIRRWSKTADPMLCVHESCYLSRGSSASAERLAQREAFGPGVALGRRGLACRSKPACVFRDIDLETLEAKLQPVDLKLLRHDRREAMRIRPDETCAERSGVLFCAGAVIAETWRAWIVPEAVARRVGPKALEAALETGLGEPAAFEARARR